MKRTVFYSWQSDLPNSTNRGFIEKALEDAANSIRDDGDVEIDPVVDRDTAGVPGAPDIAATIFGKISKADIFVCDASIINRGAQFPVAGGREGADGAPRPTPNPNVLIELGYAIHALGTSRILLVLNEACGGPELLPFDLKMRRVITYDSAETASDRGSERKKLASKLSGALRAIFKEVRVDPANSELGLGTQRAVEAIESEKPNRSAVTRRFMRGLVEKLQSLAPVYSKDLEKDDALIEALEKTPDVVSEFAKVSEAIAGMADLETASLVYRGFGAILELYTTPRGFIGSFCEEDFDYYRFLGHELFVTFFSFLIREDRWELIAVLLSDKIRVEKDRHGNPNMVDFQYVGRVNIGLLDRRNQRLKLSRTSVHADLLKQRHEAGVLGETVPFRQFMDADYFLFLRSELQNDRNLEFPNWGAFSTLYMSGRAPGFLLESVDAKYARRLLRPLGVDSIEVLRARLIERGNKVSMLFGHRVDVDPLENFAVRTVGTHGATSGLVSVQL